MKIINKDKMLLVGLAVRTNNQAELSGQGKIADSMQKFYEEYLGKIINRTDNAVLAIYTDYESDEAGAYTYFLGVSVTKTENIPAGLTIRSIPAARYQVIASKTGVMPEIILDVWRKVWADSELKQRRAYSADFEVYDERCKDLNNAQVAVYISVRE